MVNRTVAWLGCALVLALVWVPAGAGEGTAPPPPDAKPPEKAEATQAAEKPPPPAKEATPEVKAPERVSVLDQIKHPIPYFTWGGDIRIRQEYHHNLYDFQDEHKVYDPKTKEYHTQGRDDRNVIRTRYRLWGNVGPFLTDPELTARKIPNGLSFYGRLIYEPRYYSQYEPAPNPPLPDPDWNEVAVDQLYLDWQRIGGLPVSWRFGRQELHYGRDFIFGEGTSSDGSRTAYFDACKLTLHLDEIKSKIDFLCIHNRGDESDRLEPWNWENIQHPVSEYDVDARGVYFTSKIIPNHEIGAYYIGKHDDPIPLYVAKKFKENTIRTVGVILQGKTGPWDYYAEGAGQSGKFGDQRQRAYAFSSDLGYTFKEVDWTPRLHGEYEYLSGDDPNTKGTHEGWDPVFSRWPRWSEALYYHFNKEYGKTGYWTNLQRFTLGASAKPLPSLTLAIDKSLILANEHDHGTTGVYGHGLTRGCLCSPKIIWDVDQYVKMDRNVRVQLHLWLDYIQPGDFYGKDNRDDVAFLRWQFLITF